MRVVGQRILVDRALQVFDRLGVVVVVHGLVGQGLTGNGAVIGAGLAVREDLLRQLAHLAFLAVFLRQLVHLGELLVDAAGRLHFRLDARRVRVLRLRLGFILLACQRQR